MAREIVSFQKNYSDLGSIQRAYSVCYSLCHAESGLQVTMEKKQDEQLRSESVPLEKADVQNALLLVRYLFENAIPIENWRDVLDEIQDGRE